MAEEVFRIGDKVRYENINLQLFPELHGEITEIVSAKLVKVRWRNRQAGIVEFAPNLEIDPRK